MCMGLIYMICVLVLYRNCLKFVRVLYRIFSIQGLYGTFVMNMISFCILFSIVEPSHCFVWIPDVGCLTKNNTQKTVELQQYCAIMSANTIVTKHSMFLTTLIFDLE